MATTQAAGGQRWASEYETIYIMRPNIATADANKVSERITDVMNKLDAKITKVDEWGKRRMSYPIQKHSRGVYVYLRYAGYNDVVAELERNLGILEEVMRHQTVKLADKIKLEDVMVDEAETKFGTMELTGEEEKELTLAQQLGLEERPRRAGKAAEQAKDDLTKIEGIDEKVVELLAGEEIQSYADLAKADKDYLKALLTAAGGAFAGIDSDAWISAATELNKAAQAEATSDTQSSDKPEPNDENERGVSDEASSDKPSSERGEA